MAPENQPPRRTRRSHIKSRNGCITCKIRRKKCDETRPICKNCINTGRRCDGYGDSFQSLESDILAAEKGSNIVDKRSLCDSSCQGSQVRQAMDPCGKVGCVALAKCPNILQVETDQDCLYFGFFLRNSIPQFSSCYDSSFWRTVLLPQCFNCPVIQHAAVAVGAIHRFYAYEPDCCPFGNLQYAMKAYGKAIRLLRQSLDTQKHFEVGMAVCMLFAIFESFQGNHENAVMHFSHGLKAAFSLRSQDTLLSPRNRRSRLTEPALQQLIGSVNFFLGELFGREPVVDWDNTPGGFETLEEAYDDLFKQWEILSLALLQWRHIEYEYYSDLLTTWRAKFTALLAQSDHATSKPQQQRQRALRVFHEAISLLLVTRANGCDEVEERSNMDKQARYEKLNAHFSKLCMLVESLLENPDSSTHLSNAKLHSFSIKSGLLYLPESTAAKSDFSTSKVHFVAEELASMEREVAVACNLVPENALWVDLAMSLEDSQVGLRYCTSEQDGNHVWTQKVAKL